MKTELEWHEANYRDLPELTSDFSDDIVFIVEPKYNKEYADYQVGFMDNRLVFTSKSCNFEYTINQLIAWAYLPNWEQVTKHFGYDFG